MIIVGSTVTAIITIGEDIGAGAVAVIKYRTPSGVTGQLDATIVNSKKGTVSVDFTAGMLDLEGQWRVWAVFTLADGQVWKTAASPFTVYAEGELQK